MVQEKPFRVSDGVSVFEARVAACVGVFCVNVSGTLPPGAYRESHTNTLTGTHTRPASGDPGCYWPGFARSTISVISAGAPSRMGGPQKPVPLLT
jgi:hypothetical protein